MTVIEDMVERLEDGWEIIPGIAAVATPGHAPGHTSFEVRNGSQEALVAGDTLASRHVALVRPCWLSDADRDQETAAATRALLANRHARDGTRLVGLHLPGGGIGRIETGPDRSPMVQEH